MRSHLAKHVRSATPGTLRDAIHCQSKLKCLQNGQFAVSMTHTLHSCSRRPYSTSRSASDDTKTQATQRHQTIEADQRLSRSNNYRKDVADDTSHPHNIPQEQPGGLAAAKGDQLPKSEDRWTGSNRGGRNPVEESKESWPLWKAPGVSTKQGGESGSSRPGLPWISDQFRKVLRRQTSGVTVITARTAAGEPVGATVSSFASVALKPKPYFSFNITKDGITMAAINSGVTFNLHMLDSTEAGIEVAEKFVGRSKVCSKKDIWEHLKWTGGENAPPLLQGPEIPWVFNCRLAFARDVADHTLVVAEVLEITPRDEIPASIESTGGFLTFRDGWYREPGLDFSDDASQNRRIMDGELEAKIRADERAKMISEGWMKK